MEQAKAITKGKPLDAGDIQVGKQPPSNNPCLFGRKFSMPGTFLQVRKRMPFLTPSLRNRPHFFRFCAAVLAGLAPVSIPSRVVGKRRIIGAGGAHVLS